MTRGQIVIEGVRPERINAVWPEVAMMIAAALARGYDRTTMMEVRESLLKGECMLWVVRQGDAAVAALVSYVERQALVVWLMGGRDLDAWAPAVSPLLARYAREKDLCRVEAYVRPGMTRLLRRLGWRHRQSIVTLEV